jgi:retron-type reverse transcriptase
MAFTPVRKMNLVVPLVSIEATEKRTTDTSGDRALTARSGAVSQLSDRQGDGHSTMHRSTAPTTRTSRTSRPATRTTTTRTTRTASWPSADPSQLPHADFAREELVQAYLDCRRTKRNSQSALAFEIDLERNLFDLEEELRSGTYRPGRSFCFVITRPKPREVWAAQFRDRIVHHLLYNRIAPSIHARFITDSCACIPGRGTMYGAQRLEAKVRCLTQGWTKHAFYLKCDVSNFFVSIDKRVLGDLISKHVQEPWWCALAHQILFHDVREDYEYRGSPALLERVPRHKRLAEQPATHELPIGNLSSQFYANIYLNELDQFIKHQLRCKHYIRYVDDFVLLSKSTAWLSDAKEQIEQFLTLRLNIHLNPAKTILQPASRGIDFVGQVILPRRRVTRPRTLRSALHRTSEIALPDLHTTANSYFGLLRQSSHSHNARLDLAREILRRGKAVDSRLTKTFEGNIHG